MPRTNWKDMSNWTLTSPTVDVLRVFQQIVGPMHDLIISNIHESRTLAKLRDTLLPRLISGKLRIPDAEKLLAEASV